MFSAGLLCADHRYKKAKFPVGMVLHCIWEGGRLMKYSWLETAQKEMVGMY
jgi:hypothetical protein